MNNMTKILLLITGGLALVYALEGSSDDNKLQGGRGDDLEEEDVDHDELMKGIDVEMEHTDDEDIAEEIALDHLSEDPDYYTKLSTIHKDNPNYLLDEYGDEEEEEDEEDEE